MVQTERNATGIVFNIQKFSVNDGPGIRTVVFLKGCPLRCRWCANPESQSAAIEPLWDSKKCLGCLKCVEVCPQGAISHDGARIQIERKKCAGCGACVQGCAGKALSLEGGRKSVDEVMKTVMQDMPFYEESGGGITLSGGEMLSQPGFAIELLKAAKEEGLHTCCETTGFAPRDMFDRVTEQVDLLLFDLKHWDREAHIKGTGVSNELPLANMAAAVKAGKEVLPRIPVIPGFNDSPEDAKKLALLIKELGLGRCQLLPFHQYGENKYQLLGLDYAYENAEGLHREDLTDYLAAFRQQGVDAFF